MMNEYLSVTITSPCGEKSVSHQGIVVPRKGDSITVREKGTEVFGGIVSEVHWEYAVERAGVVVSVWLKKDRK